MALTGHELLSTSVVQWVELKQKDATPCVYLVPGGSCTRKGVQQWIKANVAPRGAYRQIIKT